MKKDYKDPMFIENDPMFVKAHIPWETWKMMNHGTAIAQYPGICKECGKRIAVGDDIRRSDEDDGWAHDVCN